MKDPTPRAVRLKDYRAPDFAIARTDLAFQLHESQTRVLSELAMERREGADADAPLVLDGVGLKLVSVAIDNRVLSPDEYSLDEAHLTIPGVPQRFRLRIETEINPKANTALEGLYVSRGTFCTQCEAEGFRHITYYLDRPDALSVFTTRIEADAGACPVLLSNGNLVASGSAPGGRHYAVWEDPFPKPPYLFALVAGRLARFADRFVTMSGRAVELNIWVEPGEEAKCAHAMDSLKRAMRWDEEAFGREYDLDIFNIVAVSDFNFGAMENKSLNIFNAAYVLASPETATDGDYENIEAVVAHEYFHNWSGNRVTCRDWFQLSLKEGLTVFRDQEFSADMRSRAVKRIADVRRLRARQFVEDQGPLAHPVQPASYIQINNFYTATVYEKGAEVIRMIRTLIGAEAFRRGMDLYFARHDGTAATVEDFVRAMEEASGRDLKQFRLWYTQSGTPRIRARGTYDAAGETYTLEIAQETPPTPGQPEKEPLHLPLRVGLLGRDGAPLPLRFEGGKRPGAEERVIEMREAALTLTFREVAEPPVPSLLRGFSAPVQLDVALGEEERLLLMARDPDPFTRWDMARVMALDIVKAAMRSPATELPATADAFAAALGRTLAADELDPAFKALALTLPSESEIAQETAPVDAETIHRARARLRAHVGAALGADLEATYARLAPEGPYRPDAEHAGRRALRNVALALLAARGGPGDLERALAQAETADNMTDALAALSIAAQVADPRTEAALAHFYERWRDDYLVVNKWLSLHATADRPDALERIEALTRHEAFSWTNPNKVRALIGAFATSNPRRFHRADGGPYDFLARTLLDLDGINPGVTARLASAFESWRRFAEPQRSLQKAALERLAASKSLSANLYEVVTRTLAGDA